MVSSTKDPLTFNDLMATPIDFSNIKLEYFQECFNALTDKLDWNNPEGDRYPFDLSKPLPLQGVKSVSVKKLHGYGHLEEIVNETYKFLNETFKKVWDELHHRVLDFDLGYNKEMLRRKWTAIDKKRSKFIVELIDKQMRERKIIQNLERLVGARELEMGCKMMTHIREINTTSLKSSQGDSSLKINLSDPSLLKSEIFKTKNAPPIVSTYCGCQELKPNRLLGVFLRFATQLHMLREEMANVFEKKRNLAVELGSVRGIIFTRKAAAFMFDTGGKDEAEMA
ncbi:hypothetical protein Tco_0649951 [Tanacetum coccineum]